VITGAGDKFFCIGGARTGWKTTNLFAGMLPTVDMYEAIDRVQKPVVGQRERLLRLAAGNVLQVVVRPHHRQGERRLPPGRADDGLVRRRLRHLVPGRPRGQKESQGNLVSQPEDVGAKRGSRDRAHQQGRSG